MIYECYVTRTVRENLARQTDADDIKKKLDGFLAQGKKLNASMLSANFLVSKIKDKSGLRFIWFQEIRKNVCIYVLRRIYRHDEYIKKLNDGTRDIWRRNHGYTDDERAEIEAEFARFLTEKGKDSLPEEYRRYEDKRAFDKYHDSIFYELPLWQDGMRKVPKDYWTAVQEAISAEMLKEPKNYDVFYYYHIAKHNYTITFRYGDKNANGVSDIYLLQICEGKEPRWEELLDRKYDCPDVKDLKNLSSKCYPDYYSYVYEAWKEVEEDDMANLALSEEEVRILQQVQFPFFVSGLAGSGKSTILYYLFANIYKYEAREHPNHKLLFLSYNDTLVSKARMSVKAILSYHSSNEEFKSYFEDNNNIKHFEACFVPFREFLKASFLDTESIGKFPEDKHISYENFVDKYNREYKQAGRRLSPSILWSVIRTFIKGRSLDIFTPQDYDSDEIVRADRTVAPEVYAEAFKIWKSWYRHYSDEGWWDDLDLVRYALLYGATSEAFHTYSVIFCDEAQDFTKLEIDLILRLSKYSEYNLSQNADDKRVPIAFAGDPNQTINPTGFRWAGTRAIFNRSFKDSINGYPELDDRELSKNYRSQLGIVKFANSVQSLRYEYFDENSRGRKLQSVREDPKDNDSDAFDYVAFYSYDRHKDIILENLTQANIITSGDGETDSLSNFPEIKDGQVKLNTAIGTKGLEYKAVMLFRFCDDRAYRLFQKMVKGESFDNESERFEAAHFFTKLYIAVSRARQQLFIVDTDEAYENFWKYFIDDDLWQRLVFPLVNDPDKRRLIGHIKEGHIEELPQRLSNTYDAEENARQAFEKAKSDRSAEMMRRAHSYFMEAGLSARADECDAYILLYSGNYEKAGDKFMSLSLSGKESLALTAYWAGRSWNNVLQLTTAMRGMTPYDGIRSLAARFMTSSITASEFLDLLVGDNDAGNSQAFLDFQNTYVKHLDDNEIWKTEIFGKLRTEMEGIRGAVISNSLLENFRRLLKVINSEKDMGALLAELYFKHGDFLSDVNMGTESYRKAVEIWEQIGMTDSKNYCRAKKQLATTVSEKLWWMYELNETEEIISRYGNYDPADKLDDDAQNIVFTSLLTQDFSRAVSYPYPKEQQAKWKRLYAQNRVRFLTDVVLNDFDMDKFYFLEDKIQKDGDCVFDAKLPKEVFELIFDQRGGSKDNPQWTLFAKLTDAEGQPVMKRTGNRSQTLEVLAGLLKETKDKPMDKPLASCFLDMLFDDGYNFSRADNYTAIVARIIGSGDFWKEDFRKATGRNRYFVEHASLTGDQLDGLKNRIRSFVTTHLDQLRKVTAQNAHEAQELMRAYEVCVPYQGLIPDYANSAKMYSQYIKNTRFKYLKEWMEGRRAFCQYLDEGTLLKGSVSKLRSQLSEKGTSLDALAKGFLREDASDFIVTALAGKNAVDFDSTLRAATLLYSYRLRKDNLSRTYVSTKDISDNFIALTDKAVDEVLSDKKHVDEYALKVLTFVWEVLLDHQQAAARYDALAKKERLVRLPYLVDYIKRRALLHYSYIKDVLFKAKQDEYGIPMKRDYLPVAYPHLEEKAVQMGVGKPSARKPVEGKPAPSKDINPIDIAKQAIMGVVRNMKQQGMPEEQIQKLTNISLEDIRRA